MICSTMLVMVILSDLLFLIVLQKGMVIGASVLLDPNMLPETVKQSLTVDSFKSSLKTHQFTLSDIDVTNMF